MSQASIASRLTLIMFSVPFALTVLTIFFVNPYLRMYTSGLSVVNMLYFFTFGLAGIVAIFVELPLSRPSLLKGGKGVTFATAIIATMGIFLISFAILTITGYYSPTSDTGVGNTILGWLLMPAILVMFGIEIYQVYRVHNRVFPLHAAFGG